MRDSRLPRPALRLAVAAAIVVCGAVAARAEIIEEVAAFVNGQILTRSDLMEREAQVKAQLQRQFSGDDLESKIQEVHSNLLTDMIREVILIQRAEIMGLDLDKVYKSALDNLKEQQGIKTNDELKGLMKQEGITEDELRQILLRYNVPDIMINLEVRQKISIPEADSKAYYEQHREEFRVEETYKFREIVVLSESHTDEQLQEIADKIRKDLDGGLAFAECVLKYSEAPSRFQEGMVGPVRAPDLSKDLKEVFAGLEAGGVAGPIKTKNGWHWVQLDTETKAKEPDYESVRTGIENKLKQTRFAGELETYWQRLFKENRIEVPDRYRDYASGVPKS